MARIAGRNGRVYLGIADSAATAEPLPYVSNWSINHRTSKIDVTAMGDSQKTYVSGMADASGTIGGFYDSATAQTYTAAVDGQARNFYLYPDATAATPYWFGTVILDGNFDGSVDGPVSFSADWSAASVFAKVG